ncbi:MAG: hypothetical protein KKD05_04645 [Candidatus Omnitrophica bacterium]|nr:hypothetical protein [Candidatus Omnitrophota bacterium]
MNCSIWVKLLIVIWTFVGLGLSCYLIGFPIFMKKNISVIVKLLERIADGQDRINNKE